MDIPEFLNAGAAGYLVWQYSGNPNFPIENDPHSFFEGGEVCSTLQELKSQFPNKFLGVNMYALSRHSDQDIGNLLGYLSSSCGTSVVRIFGTTRSDTPARLVRVLQIAADHDVRLIIALADYSNGSDYMPKAAPLSWYQSGYQAEYLPRAEAIAAAVAANPRASQALYAYELANEPHCGGETNIRSAYNAWVANVATAIKSKDSSAQVGIGQMASQNTTLCDSPGTTPSDFQASNDTNSIAITSGHHYTPEEKANNLAALSQAQSLSKLFYIGEASSGAVEDLLCGPSDINQAVHTFTGNQPHCINNPNPAFHGNITQYADRSVCYFPLSVTEVAGAATTEPDGTAPIRTFTQASEDKDLNGKQSTSLENLEVSSDTIINVSLPKALADRYNKDYRNGFLRNITSQKNQVASKCSLIREAVISLQDPDIANIVGTDIQLAWYCQDRVGLHPVGYSQSGGNDCRPVYTSEIALSPLCSGLGDLDDVLSQHYQPDSGQLCTGANCPYARRFPPYSTQNLQILPDALMQRIFDRMNLIPHNTINVQVIANNEPSPGLVRQKATTVSVQNAGALSDQARNLYGNVLFTKTQATIDTSQNLCEEPSTAQSYKDTAPSANLLATIVSGLFHVGKNGGPYGRDLPAESHYPVDMHVFNFIRTSITTMLPAKEQTKLGVSNLSTSNYVQNEDGTKGEHPIPGDDSIFKIWAGFSKFVSNPKQ